MKYSAKAESTPGEEGMIIIDQYFFPFGISNEQSELNPSPVEYFISSLNSCILKSVERLSALMNFHYSKAEISTSAEREDRPTRITKINYNLIIHSSDSINIRLLQKNIENHGTIFNTVKQACDIDGTIEVRKH